MARFKIRGGKFWKIFFWWDYKVMLNTNIIRLRMKLYQVRYELIFNKKDHCIYKKDKFRFWKKPEKTNAIFV